MRLDAMYRIKTQINNHHTPTGQTFDEGETAIFGTEFEVREEVKRLADLCCDNFAGEKEHSDHGISTVYNINLDGNAEPLDDYICFSFSEMGV
jgi:hypothetical protein